MRSTLSVVALCAVTAFTAACQKQKQWIEINLPSGPSAVTECNDGRNNDPDEDTFVDARDPGCHWDNNADNPNSYDPNDNTERNGPGSTGAAIPGAFTLLSAECVNGAARLAWTPSAGAEWYEFETQLWTNGPRRKVGGRVGANITSISLQADASADNYWRVIAGNSGAFITGSSLPPGSRLDVPDMLFACGAPRPAPPAPPTETPSPGGPTPDPGDPTGPPTGSSCTGASASLPDLTAKGQTKGFAISAQAGCRWALRSNNTHVVSTNPAQGSGPASGSVTALNSGTATIQFVSDPGPTETVISQRTYVIP